MSPEVVALAFVTVGGVFQYLIILPVRFGAVDIVLPGILWNAGGLHLLGIALMAYVVAAGRGSWRAPLVALWSLQVLVSLLTFSKLELILSLVLPALAAYAYHRRTRRLLAWAGVALIVYLSVPRLVLAGRGQILDRTGTVDRAGLGERMEILTGLVQGGMSAGGPQGPAPAVIGWNRLN